MNGGVRKSRTADGWDSLLEALGVFLLIMLYIWWLRLYYPWLWTVMLGFVLGSHFTRRERLDWLGFGWANFKVAVRFVMVWVGIISAALLASGFLLGTVQQLDAGRTLRGVSAYIVWGLFQQYLLNGYFTNRFLEYTGDPKGRSAPLSAAAVFSLAHLPNWFLMLVTLAGGYAAARVYLRYRSIYVLAIAHGTIGYFLLQVVPESITGHFLVGPRYILETFGTYPEHLL